MDERLLYDTLKKAEERRRLLDIIPPPGPVLLAAARNALRRSRIRPPDEPAPIDAPASDGQARSIPV